MYFVVKAGENHEDKDQVGYAHILEHIPFHGTQHFKNVPEHFERIGMAWGKQINAHTNHGFTDYDLIDISSRSTEQIKDGMRFFRDLAQGMKLTPEVANSARLEVQEEGRSLMGGRLTDSYIGKIIGYPGYVHIPITEYIGHEKIFNFEAITRYYQDWYRPDLQAVIVAGDMDTKAIEQLIQKTFSDLAMPVNPRKKEEPKTFQWKNQYLPVINKLVKSPTIEVWMKFKHIAPGTAGEFRQVILMDLFNRMMNERVLAINASRVAQLDYLYNVVNNAPLPFFISKMTVKGNTGNLKAGFQQAMLQLREAKERGFTIGEFEKAKDRLWEDGKDKPVSALNYDYSQAYSIVKKLMQHFVDGTVSPTPAYTKSVLDKITLADVNAFVRDILTDKNNRDIVFLAPEKFADIVPREDSILQWLKEADAMKIDAKPVKEELIAGNIDIMSPSQVGILTPKKSVQKEEIKELGITQLSLPNGIRVYLRPTSYDDDIVINGFGPGGIDGYPEEDRYSALWAAGLIRRSGIASVNKAELDVFTEKNKISVRPHMRPDHILIEGRAGRQDAELCLQLIYQYMVDPKKDKQGFDTLIEILKRNGTEQAGNIPKINMDRAYSIYRQQFGNAKDFSFVIAGNFDMNTMIALAEKYLGNLPTGGGTKTLPILKTRNVSGKLNVKDGMKIDSSISGYSGIVRIGINGSFDYTNENVIRMEILRKVMNSVLRERLRVIEGGTYSVIVELEADSENNKYGFVIAFQCDPLRMDELIKYAIEEIDKLKTAGVDIGILESAKLIDRFSREQEMTKARYWTGYLANVIQKKSDIRQILKRDSIVGSLMPADIQEVAKTYLK
jgi:zinc protease